MLFWKISWFHKTFYHTSHKLCSVQSIFEGISFLGQFKPYYTWAIYVSISPFLQTLIWMCGKFYSRLVCPNAVVHYYYTIYYILYYIIYLVYLKSPAGPWSPSRRGSRRWWPWWPGASGPGPSTWPGLAAGSSGNYGFQMLAFDPKHTTYLNHDTKLCLKPALASTEMFIFEVLKEWLCLVDIYRKLLPAYLFPATRALHPSMAVHRWAQVVTSSTDDGWHAPWGL